MKILILCFCALIILLSGCQREEEISLLSIEKNTWIFKEGFLGFTVYKIHFEQGQIHLEYDTNKDGLIDYKFPLFYFTQLSFQGREIWVKAEWESYFKKWCNYELTEKELSLHLPNGTVVFEPTN